jgi:UDP-2,3-diacylglucosamine hydrolase
LSSTLFISDLHLDADRPALTAAFARFLQAHRNSERLYILGDLFEAWVGDDDDAPLASEVARLLRAFSDAGPGLFLMRGNRDFLLGETFCTRSGATLIEDPTVIDLYGEPALLMHGDTLCTADTDYQAFRRTVRQPAWRSRTLALPLQERRALASQLRSESLGATGNKPAAIMDVAPQAVDRVMSERGVAVLIHGHTHRPGVHEVAMGERWVLGDWGATAWILAAGPRERKLINLFDNQ